MTFNIRKKSRLLGTSGLLATALVMPACAVDPYDDYRYDDDVAYGYDRYDDNDRRYYGNDTVYLEDVSTRGGIDEARRAHRNNSEYYAERVDGNCENVVTVRRGDTLSDIAEYCDVPVRALMETNSLYSPHKLEVGQRLRVPYVKGNVYEGVQFFPARYSQNTRPDYQPPRRDYQPARDDHYQPRRDNVAYYTARRGEDLDDISERFEISERTIISLNPQLLHDDVDTGDRIALPEEVVRYTQSDRRSDNRRYDDDRRRYQDHTRYDPVIRLSDDTIRRGEDIEIIVEDLPPESDIILSFGDSQDHMREYHRASTDRDGRYRHEISFEDDDYRRDQVIVGVRTADNKYRIYSKPVRYSRQYSHLN
ncbi:LysM peptidoglycan-binding domain-containing protein [Parvularcula marina]|uniref:LysM peptidoglycan-binding domain-containing protein n=1 Tax=Parvularcula marina TaxID=2292771 RepID=UPI0035198482